MHKELAYLACNKYLIAMITKLIQKFEEDYPTYHQLKYDTQLATVEQLQARLQQPGIAFVEYFFGSEQVYIFSVTSKDVRVNRVAKCKELMAAMEFLPNFCAQALKH